MRQLLRRCWYVVRWRRFERDLKEELAFHELLKANEFEQLGYDRPSAIMQAKRALGSVALAQDRSRDVWQPR